MKDWFIMVRTYNSYGGHSTLSLLSEFFLKNMPDLGPALQELSTTFHFAHPGPPRPTLEGLFETYHSDRAKLPKAAYRRSRESASVDFSSELLSGSDLERFGVERMDWFNHGAVEIIENLDHLVSRFKKTDNFDIKGLIAHCRARLQFRPKTESEFKELLSALKEDDKRRRESLSPWEKLGIDFRDFHPEARKVLDDPFFWDSADDFAPNGNDTGADALEEYRTWLGSHSARDAKDFLEELLLNWQLADDDLVCAEATIGLAFADIKLRGECHSGIRASALEALSKLLIRAEKQSVDRVREDWVRAIGKMEAKLRAISAS